MMIPNEKYNSTIVNRYVNNLDVTFLLSVKTKNKVTPIIVGLSISKRTKPPK